jgi:GNAT superfamily N-acetyltransferase
MFAPAPIGTLGVVEVDVERIPVAASYPLRQAVLRPHQTIDRVAAPGDDDPESATFGVIDRATGSVVGTATVLRAEAPMAKDGADFTSGGAGGAPAWRLRYMATRDDLRGQGLGSRALEAALAHVAAEGGRGGMGRVLVWCNARVPAIGFYERAGFQTWGEQWDSPLGPHVVMWRTVDTEGGHD